MDEKLQEYRLPIMVGLVTFSIGGGIGYIVGKRNRQVHYIFDNQTTSNFDVDDAVKKTKEIYEQEKEAKKESKEETTSNIGETFVVEGIEKVDLFIGETPDEDVELVTKSVFEDKNDIWNYPTEIAKRTPDEPYVIHRDEFYADEMDYLQSTLTFYSGDNILVDEEDAPIYNHDLVTGPLLFGHGSGDPNVVHIRNDKRKSEYEILFDPGLYSVEVLGLDIENNQRVEDIKHSKNRKFRLE